MDIYDELQRADMLSSGSSESNDVRIAIPPPPSQLTFIPYTPGQSEVYLSHEGHRFVVRVGNDEPPFLSVAPGDVRVRGQRVEDNQELYYAIAEVVRLARNNMTQPNPSPYSGGT